MRAKHACQKRIREQPKEKRRFLCDMLKRLVTGLTVTAKLPANITNQIRSMINRANTATAACLDVSYHLINP